MRVALTGLNIGAHKEAAEHFLSALAMQETTEGKSEQLLATLRRVFLAMVRPLYCMIIYRDLLFSHSNARI